MIAGLAALGRSVAETVDGVLLGMRFTRQGQSCTAGSRLFVHNDAYGNMKRDQIRHYGGRVIGTELNVPDFVRALPRDRWAHSSDVMDYAQLAGKRVAVVGTGATAVQAIAEIAQQVTLGDARLAITVSPTKIRIDAVGQTQDDARVSGDDSAIRRHAF